MNVLRATSGLRHYLSPEPLLQDPAYVRAMAKRGMSVPTYAYAANNPLKYTDPTGLAIGEGLAQCYSDCLQATLYPDEKQAGAEMCVAVAGAAAATPAFEEAAMSAAWDIGRWFTPGNLRGGNAALNATGRITAGARAGGAALAAGAVVAEVACLVSCRNNWAPQYINRNDGESADSQRDAPWWRFW